MVTDLFTYNKQGKPTAHQSITATLKGIAGNRHCHLLCQVLLLPTSSLKIFNLGEAALKENVIVDMQHDIHQLPSGTALRIGDAELRLTFHCEPCHKIKPIVSPKKIVHQRGYLAQIVKAGSIQSGNAVTVLDKRYASIPYEKADRIKWYLDQQDGPVMVAKLVEDIGLPKSYCRAVPNIIRNRPDIDQDKITYANRVSRA